jgi:hypothetical protein
MKALGKSFFLFITGMAAVMMTTTMKVEGFVQTATKRASFKKSSLTQEAVDIFGAKYPFNQTPVKKSTLSKLAGLGVPKVDIDGTRYDKFGKGSGKRLTDISEKQAADTFNEIARLYGGERAIQMVKIFPICLAFDKKQFAGSFSEWCTIFGVEETQEMYVDKETLNH